jgi:hypothetical protein
MAHAFQTLGYPAVGVGPPGAGSAHHDYGVGFEDGLDGFIGVAHQVDIDVGFDGNVVGERAETAASEGQRHLWLIERERIGNDFEDEKADARREALGELRGGLKRFEGFRDGGVQDDNLHCGLLGYDGAG